MSMQAEMWRNMRFCWRVWCDCGGCACFFCVLTLVVHGWFFPFKLLLFLLRILGIVSDCVCIFCAVSSARPSVVLFYV
jgi:hypothetical protein